MCNVVVSVSLYPSLQAAKLIRSSDIGVEGRRKVFDAVGFNFLNRMLATSECMWLLCVQHSIVLYIEVLAVLLYRLHIKYLHREHT